MSEYAYMLWPPPGAESNPHYRGPAPRWWEHRREDGTVLDVRRAKLTHLPGGRTRVSFDPPFVLDPEDWWVAPAPSRPLRIVLAGVLLRLAHMLDRRI